jgi:hypothetical protein
MVLVEEGVEVGLAVFAGTVSQLQARLVEYHQNALVSKRRRDLLFLCKSD